MSLMTMQLWTLAAVGPAIFLILAVQTLLAVAFAGIILFRLMGSDYESAVMASGFVGVFLGVTSTGCLEGLSISVWISLSATLPS